MTPFYAHSGRKADYSDWQLLADHLRRVARLARARAGRASPGDASLALAADAAGLLHDLGKFRPEFQRYIRNLPVPREKTYHKQAGAAVAADARHWPLAFAIAGHHGGVPDSADLRQTLAHGDAARPVARAVWPDAVADCPELARLTLEVPAPPDALAADLFTRLLFSCLVDADWSDTADHARSTRGEPPEPPPPPLDAAGWLEKALACIERRAAVCPDPTVRGVRREVLEDCLAAADQLPGLFSLSVPTGGGKTLSSLAFALKHAAAHGHRRVVYVAPYLSILDQNAEVIREALGLGPGAPEVFEHHSLAEPPGDEDQNETRREAAARRAENWDAPVVLTTNVQFFESLFANKPGRCRKLHNVARSVIILDECQTLPPDLVAPTCARLNQLAARLGCSVVLCTATQPAFSHDDLKPDERLHDVREIVGPGRDLFGRLRRVSVCWPRQTAAPLEWAEVARQMLAEKAALCIVNARRAARELFDELRKQPAAAAFHLSTSMCPAHRLTVLGKIKKRLAAGEPCYLASTQLIEAGVDVDFPFVMREMGPLESVVQSAGRCNREGRLNGPDGSPGGRVVVFRSAAEAREPRRYYPPDRWYKAGRSVLETSFLSAGREPAIDDPAALREYFVRLYRSGDLDAQGIRAHLHRAEFQSAAQKYRLIDDDGEPVVVLTWAAKRAEIETFLDAVRHRPSRAAYRRLVPYQVNLRRDALAGLSADVAEVAPGLLAWSGGYDADTGLKEGGGQSLLIV
jgi:CRISPR-associated endonuclease/helicase Cas3